ncbi:MAG TPA: 16S rRNA (uracil(1498)-N(3))-methyltransferase [Thermoanaerobaculia bacterium]|nr:16S rRNA (uracil(1498)-N(3))-methyltransferase [Thermoanaerobaculia bacterium]
MKHRFYVPLELKAGEAVTLAGEEFHHAARVVRVRAGEEVEVFDGHGNAAAGIVDALERQHAIVTLRERIASRESVHAIHLAMAIIQLEKFELVLQKATELGVRSILPLVTERVELRPERYRGKADRWNRIVFEATKQCGRAMIPIVESPIAFEEAVKRDGAKILFDADAPADPPTSEETATLFIGPEGGWSEDELALARAQGCAFAQLGIRRLRAETAAIVACARHMDI